MTQLQDRLRAALGKAYHLERELGGGGMSRVFAARELELGRQVVVKVLPPEMASGVSAERFRREIQLAASLQHPHIVPLLTAGHHGDLVYYTMPLIQGESLRAKLTREGELPIPEALRILRDVADALAYAHAHNVVHRDIKPDNVLLTGQHAVVTDFGVAKALSDATGSTALTSLGVALGTPAYMAPEQAAADPHVDHRADIYALGALAYELLSGRPPFVGANPQQILAAHITQAPEPVTRHRAAVSPALAALVMRCLEKRAADRWQWAAEVHAQLETLATATGEISSGTAAAIRRSHPARVATLFGFAALGALTLVYLLVQLLGLPDWAFAGAVGLAAAGLPIMLWTGVIERRRAIAGSTGGVAVPGGVHRWFTWRRARLGGAAAFGLLGVGTATYMAMRLLGIGPVGTLVASGVLAERDRLVLADFENRTADSTLGLSVGEAFRIDLTQSPVVRLLDGTTVADALRRMNRPPGTRLTLALARELAQREGARAVVHGQVGPLGRGYVLAAELVAPSDGAVLVALRETAKDDGAIVDAVDRLSKRLRERIGESLRTIRASEPLEQVTTASLEALRKYSQSERASDAGQVDRAVALLTEAVALDTTFGMAYRKLAVLLRNTSAARSRGNAAATKAFQHRDRLTPIERYLAEAFYYSSAEFDRDKVEQAYRAALEVDPENITALNNLALAWNEQRRYAEAESSAARGIAIAPTVWTLYVNLTRAQMAQGKVDEAGETVDLLAQRAGGHPLTLFMRERLAEARRDFDSSAVFMRQLAQAARDLPWQARSASGLALLSVVRGRVTEGEAYARSAAAANERRGLPGAALQLSLQSAVIDLRYRNAGQRALRQVDDAVRQHPLTGIPAEDRPYLPLAWFYAAAGRPDRARLLLAEYEAAIPEPQRRAQPFRHGAAAAVAMAEGRVQDAINGYRAWYAEDSCPVCGLFDLAQAYERAGERDSAIATYERAISTPGLGRTPDGRLFDEGATLGPTYKRLGELYEERGELDKARDYYGRFVDLWKDADPEFRAVVADVRQRLARLSAERAR